MRAKTYKVIYAGDRLGPFLINYNYFSNKQASTTRRMIHTVTNSPSTEVHTTHFWNNLYQVCSYAIDRKTKGHTTNKANQRPKTR